MRPDALDLPGRQRRIFLDAETGSSGLAPRDAREAHAKRRLERYVTFFNGFADQDMTRTWYRAAFRDGFAPEVVFLVVSDARRARVERVIHDTMGSGQHRFGVRVLTLASAAVALAPLVAAPGTPSATGPGPARVDTPGVRTVRIEPDVARRLTDGLQLFVRSYNSLRHDTVAHAGVCPVRYSPPPCPVAELNAFRELLLHDILGNPRDPPKGRTS